MCLMMKEVDRIVMPKLKKIVAMDEKQFEIYKIENVA